MNGYETVINSVSTEEIRKSRFITVVRRVKSEEELFGELAAIRKEYSDATHVCYASVFDKSGLAARFSDDGEPSGTAGQPILETIRKSGLKEILVAVVRYFGGIKLGAGGLTRAYSGCASGAIAEAGRVECELCGEYRVSASFATAKKISGALGGVIVDGGKFDWEKSGKFDCLVQPDESYHGLSYTKTFGNAAYIVKARVQLMRDLGSTPSPMNAFLLDLGIQTLHLRMERHSENALAVAKYLSRHPKVKSVTYPALESDKGYELCNKYLGGKGSGVISFELGSYEACVKFMDSLRLAAIVVHVADARTGVLHPASSTHRQLTDEQLVAAGISKGTVRLSVGIENADDIIADLAQALVNA